MFFDHIEDALIAFAIGLLCVFMIYVFTRVITLTAKCCIRYTRKERKLKLEEPTVYDVIDACENDSIEEFNELYDWMEETYVDINQQFEIKKYIYTISSYTLEHGKLNIFKHMLLNNFIDINKYLTGYICIFNICKHNIYDQKTCEIIISSYDNVHEYKNKYTLFRWCLKYHRLDLLKLLVKREDFDINYKNHDISEMFVITDHLDFYLVHYLNSYSYTDHRLDKNIELNHIKIMKLLLHNGIHVTDNSFEYVNDIKPKWKTMYSCDWSIFIHRCYPKEFKDTVVHMLFVLKNIPDITLPRDIKCLIISYTARVYKSDY